jgi:hypothetical protein
VQKPELRRREVDALSADERLHDRRVDPQLLDLDCVAARTRATSSSIENGFTM